MFPWPFRINLSVFFVRPTSNDCRFAYVSSKDAVFSSVISFFGVLWNCFIPYESVLRSGSYSTISVRECTNLWVLCNSRSIIYQVCLCVDPRRRVSLAALDVPFSSVTSEGPFAVLIGPKVQFESSPRVRITTGAPSTAYLIRPMTREFYGD